MPWALLVGEMADPEKALADLAENGRIRAVEGGWLVELDESDHDPARAANRARQARFRDRKRNARNASESVTRNARNASEPVENSEFGGISHSLSPVKPEERESEIPKSNARNAVTRNAVTRNARNAEEQREIEQLIAWCEHCGRPSPCHCPDAEPHQPPPQDRLTDTEREHAQARIRELSARLRAERQ